MFNMQHNSYLFAVYNFNNKIKFNIFKIFSTLLHMALDPAIMHSMHVCITFFSVEMQTHITCRWSGSAPFVTSLTRVQVWTQLINTKRCQRALESWLRCIRLPLFPSHLVRPHQERSSVMLWHVHSHSPCLTLHLPPPLPSLSHRKG